MVYAMNEQRINHMQYPKDIYDLLYNDEDDKITLLTSTKTGMISLLHAKTNIPVHPLYSKIKNAMMVLWQLDAQLLKGAMHRSDTTENTLENLILLSGEPTRKLELLIKLRDSTLYDVENYQHMFRDFLGKIFSGERGTDEYLKETIGKNWEEHVRSLWINDSDESDDELIQGDQNDLSSKTYKSVINEQHLIKERRFYENLTERGLDPNRYKITDDEIDLLLNIHRRVVSGEILISDLFAGENVV